MIRTNKLMERLLENLIERDKNLIKVKVGNISTILFPNLIKVHDCIIVDIEKEVTEEDINFKEIISMYGDRTGYEASCNEIRINDYVDFYDDYNILSLSKVIIQAWKYKLKTEYPGYKFLIILAYREGYATLRFHIFREDEGTWLLNDLNVYKEEAILVEEV
ncbi:hypothetical protein [Clostridium sporogenes]